MRVSQSFKDDLAAALEYKGFDVDTEVDSSEGRVVGWRSNGDIPDQTVLEQYVTEYRAVKDDENIWKIIRNGGLGKILFEINLHQENYIRKLEKRILLLEGKDPDSVSLVNRAQYKESLISLFKGID